MWFLQRYKQPGVDPLWHGVAIATPDFSQLFFLRMDGYRESS